MDEMRQLNQEQAIEQLLDAVENVLCSCLAVENQEDYLIDRTLVFALEDAYEIVVSFQAEERGPAAAKRLPLAAFGGE